MSQFLNEKCHCSKKESAQDNEEEGSHLFEAECHGPFAMGVEYLCHGITASQVHHHVTYPGVPETQVNQHVEFLIERAEER